MMILVTKNNLTNLYCQVSQFKAPGFLLLKFQGLYYKYNNILVCEKGGLGGEIKRCFFMFFFNSDIQSNVDNSSNNSNSVWIFKVIMQNSKGGPNYEINIYVWKFK